MTVYVVVGVDYEEHEVTGVYSSMESAKRAIALALDTDNSEREAGRPGSVFSEYHASEHELQP